MPSNNRPHVVMQMAASIDGRIAVGPDLTMFDRPPASDGIPDGGLLWSRVAKAVADQWHPEGTMMGSGTVQSASAPLRVLPPFAGDPQLLHTDFLPEDVVAKTTAWAILVDGRGRCRSGYKGSENPGGHILHLVSQAAPAEYLAFLRRERIPYLIGGQAHADLPGALEKLYTLLRVRAIHLEGGGTLNGAMLRAGLVDEIHLLVQPVMIGGRRTPTLADCDDLSGAMRPAVLQLVSATPAENGYVWLHYTVNSV